MFDANTCINALLFCLFHICLRCAHLAAGFVKGGNLFVVCFKLESQRMIGRNTDKRGTHQCVWPCCIDLNLVHAVRSIYGFEAELKPAGFSNPIGLHQFDFRRPVVKPVNCAEQIFCKIRNFEKPLRELASLNQCARAPTTTVFHLLIGKHRHVYGIPVHDSIFTVNQSSLKKIKEQRLLLSIIFRITRRKFARPIDRKTERFHLITHLFDIIVCPIFRMASARHSGIFCWHSKGVPAHGVQHIISCTHFVARNHVAHCVIAYMPDVQFP